MTHDADDVVLVPVRGREDARRFYETLGFAEHAHDTWLARGEVRIHLHTASDDAPHEPVELAIEADDPTAVAERCWNAGYSVRVEQAGRGRMRLFVIDPFDNRVELLGTEAARSGAERCA